MLQKGTFEQMVAEDLVLSLEDRREEGLRGVPPDAARETVIVKSSAAACFGTCANMVVI